MLTHFSQLFLLLVDFVYHHLERLVLLFLFVCLGALLSLFLVGKLLLNQSLEVILGLLALLLFAFFWTNQVLTYKSIIFFLRLFHTLRLLTLL